MGFYNIVVREYYEKNVRIKADSSDSALSIARQRYRDEEIILDSSSCYLTEMECTGLVEEEETT